MKKFLIATAMLTLGIGLWANTPTPSETPSQDESPPVAIRESQLNEQELNDSLLNLFDNIPLQGITEEDFLIIAPDPLTDWVSVIMNTFYTMGSADQIRKYVPELRAKDQVIEEKDLIIDAQAAHIDRMEDVIRDIGSSNAVLQDDVEKYRELYETWRFRTWVIGGVSVGVIGVAGLTLWLVN